MTTAKDTTVRKLLSVLDVKNASDLKHEDVEVPEWGGVIRIVQMGAEESMAFTTEMTTQANTDEGIFRILIHCAVNVDGSKMFTLDDLAMLKTKNFAVLNRLQTVALRLNSMRPADEVARKKD